MRGAFHPCAAWVRTVRRRPREDATMTSLARPDRTGHRPAGARPLLVGSILLLNIPVAACGIARAVLLVPDSLDDQAKRAEELLDPLPRYEAHLSRELDRALARFGSCRGGGHGWSTPTQKRLLRGDDFAVKSVRDQFENFGPRGPAPHQ